jgi:hypothetical protein
MSHTVRSSSRSPTSWTLLRRVLGACVAVGATACTPGQVRYQSDDPAPQPTGTVEAILYLVGDAGEVNAERDDVLAHLTLNIDSEVHGGSGPPVVVAFLGDNIYDEGLPTAPSATDVEKLAGQVRALPGRPNVEGIFVPGNHDWANGASLVYGRRAIVRQREWIGRFSPGRNVRFLPDDGCPGPVTHDVGESVHLVLIDTEWLLRNPEDECGTPADFYARLTADLRANRDRRIVMMSHHPLASGGPHGGNVAPLQRGPFVYYLASKSGVGVQDLASRRYSTVIRELRKAIAASGTRPLAHAGGHDHTLQVIGMTGPGSPGFQLVSGAGSKSERSRRVAGMRYATDGFGYMRLDFTEDGVGLTVFARDVDSGPVRPVFACQLAAAGTVAECPEAPLSGAQR